MILTILIILGLIANFRKLLLGCLMLCIALSIIPITPFYFALQTKNKIKQRLLFISGLGFISMYTIILILT